MGLFRRRNSTPPPPPPPPPTGLVKPVERTEKLTEWGLLFGVADRTDAQERRFWRLAEELWPESDGRNPMSGIRRVSGGHGYPIPIEIARQARERRMRG